ncbi:MAG: cyclic nucleotide-binding domain-containing protein, partial [Myxococcota bacterium]|nr:cyclic nucleotide-binding domain-containing protein [Myxococcota bacterium]
FVVNILIILAQNKEKLVGSVMTATLFKGQLAVYGAIFACRRKIYFLPTNILDRTIGKNLYSLSVRKIVKLSAQTFPQERLLISTNEDTWSLEVNGASLYQSIFANDISEILSSKRQKRAVDGIENKIIYMERGQCKFKDDIFFGYIVLTNQEFAFVLESDSSIWVEVEIFAIKFVEPSDYGIRLCFENEKEYEFRCIDDDILNLLSEKLENCRPPKELKDPRGAQPVSMIKGKAYDCIIDMNAGERYRVSQLRLMPSSDGIRLLISEPIGDWVLPPNSRVTIDLAKDFGRFYFCTRVNFIKKQPFDPVVKALILLQYPDSIFRHNLRENFRMPMIQHTYASKFFRYNKQDDVETLDIPSFMGEKCPFKVGNPPPIQINDISVTGTQITLPFIPPEATLRRGLYLGFPIVLDGQERSVAGKLIYAKPNPRNPAQNIVGIKFNSLNTTIEKQLLARILEIERLALRKMHGTMLDSDRETEEVEILNPILRSATKLTNNRAFSKLTLGEAAQFLAAGEIKTFSEGDTIIREGELGDSLIVLTEGRVEVRVGGTFLAKLYPGAAIGEMALIDQAPRSATISALSDGVYIEIRREIFNSTLEQGNQITIKVLQGITGIVLERLNKLKKLIKQEVVKPKGNVFSRLWSTMMGEKK